MANRKQESRFLEIDKLEIRDGEGAAPLLRGYAAVFGVWSVDLGGFRERIAKGAFADSVSRDDIRAFWSHNTDYVLGRTRANTLRLSEDDYGLAFELDINLNTSWGRDAYETIKRGDVTGVSFGFSVLERTLTKSEDGGPPLRTLQKVRLFEVSPTAFPAYEATNVSARSIDDIVNEEIRKELAELEAVEPQTPLMRNKLRRIELDIKER